MLLLLETLTLYQIYNIYLTTSVKTVDLLFLCCFYFECYYLFSFSEISVF